MIKSKIFVPINIHLFRFRVVDSLENNMKRTCTPGPCEKVKKRRVDQMSFKSPSSKNSLKSTVEQNQDSPSRNDNTMQSLYVLPSQSPGNNKSMSKPSARAGVSATPSSKRMTNNLEANGTPLSNSLANSISKMRIKKEVQNEE